MSSFSELRWYEDSESFGTKAWTRKRRRKTQQRTQLLHIAFHGVYYFSILFYTDTLFLAGVMERWDANIDTPFFVFFYLLLSSGWLAGRYIVPFWLA
jgi:hypothetical protein